MAYDTYGRSFKHGSITLTENSASPGPYSVVIVTDQGDLSWTEPKPVVQQIQRGNIASTGSHPIAGPDEAVTWSFTGIITKFAGATTVATPYSITKGTGFASVGSAGEVYMFQMVYTITHPDTTTTAETITFAKCFLEGSLDISEGEPSTFSFSGADWELAPTVA
jgi:hypothetical protein